MHLSVKLIFTLAGQMTTTGEETHTSRMGRADWLSSVRHYEKHLSSSGLLKRGAERPCHGGQRASCKDLLKHFTLIVNLALLMPYS